MMAQFKMELFEADRVIIRRDARCGSLTQGAQETRDNRWLQTRTCSSLRHLTATDRRAGLAQRLLQERHLRPGFPSALRAA